MQRPNFLYTKLAVGCWLLSLALPTVVMDGTLRLGYELLWWLGPRAMLVLFMHAPAAAFAVLMNVVFFWQVLRITASGTRDSNEPSEFWTVLAIVVILIAGMMSTTWGRFAKDVMALPGYWAWLASFVLLFVAIRRGDGPARQATRCDGEDYKTSR